MVCIPLGHSDILVAQQFCDFVDVHAGLRQAGRKCVAKIVKPKIFDLGPFRHDVKGPHQISPEDLRSYLAVINVWTADIANPRLLL